MTSKKHGEYTRPEISRTNDLLAKDQRKIVDFQKKQLEMLELNNKSEIDAFLRSKIYSNLQKNVEFCVNFCYKDSKPSYDSPIRRRNVEDFNPDEGCLDKCISKKSESFSLLVEVKFSNLVFFCENKK